MGYKATEQDLMAYLYGELEGKEKEDGTIPSRKCRSTS